LSISGLVNPLGDRVYAWSNGGAVDVFSFDSATGALGPAPLFSIPVADTVSPFGVDQMAITRDGNKLYVSQPNALNVYDANTGAFLTAITDPAISEPTGVCLPSMATPLSAPVGGQVMPASKGDLTAPWAVLAVVIGLVLVGGAVVVRRHRV
jgi:DNA-binding beta-propeller fold protein YncE